MMTGVRFMIMTTITTTNGYFYSACPKKVKAPDKNNMKGGTGDGGRGTGDGGRGNEC